MSAFRLPIELGIVPEILVLYRDRSVSAVRLPIELGIVPERFVSDKSREVSKLRFPIDLGIAPFKLLLERSSCWTVHMDEQLGLHIVTFAHVTPYQLF